MAAGSRLLWTAVSNPLPTIGSVLALVALVIYLLTRATWRPAAPLRLARQRTWGQVLAAATRMYVSRLRLFVGLGVLLLPISVLITLLQAALFHASSFAGVETEGEAAGVFVLLVVGVGTALTLLALGLVQAATVTALVEIDSGRPVRALRAYRTAFGHLLPLVAPIVIAVLVVTALASFVFLIPVAVWVAVRCALVVPVVALEGLGPLAALRRSSTLVRGSWLKVGSLTLLSAGIALVAGPLVGTVLIVLTNAPLTALNLVAGVVYMLTMPFVALTTAYVYVDARVTDSLRPERTSGELPAQAELWAGAEL
jgi:hypothetical protein